MVRSPCGIDGARLVRALATAADIDLAFRMGGDLKPGAAEHRFHACAVGYPPVRPIVRVAPFDEVQLGISRFGKWLRRPEVVVFLQWLDHFAAALHGLDQQEIAGDVLVNEIECQERVSQMVEHAQKEHDIESLAKRTDVIYRHVAELDVEANYVGSE